ALQRARVECVGDGELIRLAGDAREPGAAAAQRAHALAALSHGAHDLATQAPAGAGDQDQLRHLNTPVWTATRARPGPAARTGARDGRSARAGTGGARDGRTCRRRSRS